jgi:hypothetical protein
MKKIGLIDVVDVRSILDNRLRKLNKLISKGEIKSLIALETLKQVKWLSAQLSKLRARINEIERRLEKK